MGSRDVLRAVARRFPRAAWIYRNLSWRSRADKSQYGEEGLLDTHLPPTGLFLEVGAFQPIMFSNTWALERRGWRGVAVDANPDYAFAWRLFRPRTPYWSFAITPDGQEHAVLFRTDPRFGAVSSLFRGHVEKWSVPEGTEINALTVQACSVRDLLEMFVSEFGAAPDFIQLDCEGLDAELVHALLTTVPSEHLPRHLMIESLEADGAAGELSSSYRMVGSAGVSQLFVRMDDQTSTDEALQP